ncbi:MAG TPA: hypothetical protein PLD82_09370, partial [Spirochaetota bacterium]|nr:hypothetical protein [Spirochaetota bacterium]
MPTLVYPIVMDPAVPGIATISGSGAAEEDALEALELAIALELEPDVSDEADCVSPVSPPVAEPSKSMGGQRKMLSERVGIVGAKAS